MDDDFGIAFELSLLTSNIKKLCNVFDSFLSFLRRYEKRKTHNMFSVMLDSQFKNLRLVSSFVDHESGIWIVEKYDKKSLHPMPLNCYRHLHLVINYEIGFEFVA